MNFNRRPIIDASTFANQRPPADLVAEAALLGAAVLDPRVIGDAVTAGLTSEAFDHETHRAVWSAFLACSRGPSLDLVAVASQLRRDGTLDRVGGESYLERLVRETPGSVGAPAYIAAILDCWTRRRIIDAAFLAVHAAYEPSGRTTSDVAALACTEIENATRATVAAKETNLGDAAVRVIERIGKGEAALVPTGIETLDATCGLPRQGLVTIMGIPASGKTTLSLVIAANLARAGLPVRVFSYEQSAERIAATLLSNVSGHCVHGMLNGRVPAPGGVIDDLSTAAVDLSGLDFGVVSESLNADQIKHRCAAYSRQGIKAVVVDYLQHLPPIARESSEEGKVGDSMKALARIALDNPMLVIVVSQMTLSATRENRAPRATDGRGAQEINAASDMMFGVHRPHQNASLTDFPDMDSLAIAQQECDVWVLKNKYGPMGMARLRFMGAKMQFEGR